MSDYYRVDLHIKPYTADAADLMAAFLADAGFDTFEEREDGLSAYIPAADYEENKLKEIIESFPMEAEISTEKELIKHQDWNEEWEKKYFKPLVLGNGRCVVHSTFHNEYPSAEYEIIIDPKMAFGTGHHSTTTMMVNHLFSIDLKDKRVIDMGTGTGILAIIAKKLGAARVSGIEIDPSAWENAVENASLNKEDVELICGDASALGAMEPADIFLANINRNIILADLENYTKAMKPGSQIILSGFYNTDIPLIEAALKSNGCEIEETTEEGENWSSIRAILK